MTINFVLGTDILGDVLIGPMHDDRPNDYCM